MNKRLKEDNSAIICNDRKGSVMILVVVITAVILLLGGALLDIALTDVRIARNYQNAQKAYYLAESGIEKAVALLVEHDASFRGSFYGEDDGGGTFAVTVSAFPGDDGGEWLHIQSTGTVDGARDLVGLRFQVLPPLPATYVHAASLGWLDEKSGLIAGDTDYKGEEALLLSSAAPGSGVLLLEPGPAAISSKALFFEGDPSLKLEGILTLSAEVIVFRGTVYLDCDCSALLFVEGPSGRAGKVYFVEPVRHSDGSVVLQPGCYQFGGDYTVNAGSSQAEVRSYEVFPAVPGTMSWYSWAGGEGL